MEAMQEQGLHLALVLMPGLCAQRLGGPQLRQIPHGEEVHQVPGAWHSGHQRRPGTNGKGRQWGGEGWGCPQPGASVSRPHLVDEEQGPREGQGHRAALGPPQAFLHSAQSEFLSVSCLRSP